MFSNHFGNFLSFSSNLKLSSGDTLSLKESKIYCLAKGFSSTGYNITLVSPFPKSQPFPEQRILDSSILKEFADDNFKLDENGRKLSK